MNITINGWTFDGKVRMRKGVYANRYRHTDGRTAQEILGGVRDAVIAISVFDQKGKRTGTVKNTMELTK